VDGRSCEIYGWGKKEGGVRVGRRGEKKEELGELEGRERKGV